MFDISLRLQRMHCNEEADGGSAEPYMWTVFFHLDIDTVLTPGARLVTYTPHSNWTTRGMYRNGVDPGEDSDIPASMGLYDVSLDEGNLGIVLVGCLFVIIDDGGTDGDAIKAGHEALAVSADRELNALIESKVSADDKTPTPMEIQQIADRIESDVTSAIKGKLSWWDVLDGRDRFVGFGHLFFPSDELQKIADTGTPGTEEISVKVRKERFRQGPFGVPLPTLFDDYDVIGEIQVTKPERPSPFASEFEDFDQAVSLYKSVEEDITNVRDKLSKAKGEKRSQLRARLKYLQKFPKKEAIRDIAATRAVLNAKRKLYRQALHEPDCSGSRSPGKGCQRSRAE